MSSSSPFSLFYANYQRGKEIVVGEGIQEFFINLTCFFKRCCIWRFIPSRCIYVMLFQCSNFYWWWVSVSWVKHIYHIRTTDQGRTAYSLLLISSANIFLSANIYDNTNCYLPTIIAEIGIQLSSEPLLHRSHIQPMNQGFDN